MKTILHRGGTAFGMLPPTVDPDDGITPIAATWAAVVFKNGAATANAVTISIVAGFVGVYKWQFTPVGTQETDQFSILFTATIATLPHHHVENIVVVDITQTAVAALETATAANARQTILVAEHEATQTALAGSGSDSDAIADSVVAKLGAGTATAIITTGNVTGFPSTLTIGDAYLQTNGRQITLRLRAADDSEIVSYGSKLFSDQTFAPVVRMSKGSAPSEVTAIVTWVDGVDSHFVVELPATETAKAKPDHDYSWQLILNWDGDTNTETTPIDAGTVRFTRKIKA